MKKNEHSQNKADELYLTLNDICVKESVYNDNTYDDVQIADYDKAYEVVKKVVEEEELKMEVSKNITGWKEITLLDLVKLTVFGDFGSDISKSSQVKQQEMIRHLLKIIPEKSNIWELKKCKGERMDDHDYISCEDDIEDSLNKLNKVSLGEAVGKDLAHIDMHKKFAEFEEQIKQIQNAFKVKEIKKEFKNSRLGRRREGNGVWDMGTGT